MTFTARVLLVCDGSALFVRPMISDPIDAANIRSAVFWSVLPLIEAPGRPSDDSSTPERKLCPSPAAGNCNYATIGPI